MMKARHSVAKLMRWTYGILFALLVIASLIWRAEVKPERILPEIDEQQEEPKSAVIVYVLLSAILFAISLVLLFVEW